MAHTGPDFVSTHAMLPEPSGYTTSSFTLKGQRRWATNSVAVHVWCDKVCGFYQTSWIRWSLGVAEQKQSCTLFFIQPRLRGIEIFFSAQKIHNRWASPAPSEPFEAPCSPSGKFNCRILGTKSDVLWSKSWNMREMEKKPFVTWHFHEIPQLELIMACNTKN